MFILPDVKVVFVNLRTRLQNIRGRGLEQHGAHKALPQVNIIHHLWERFVRPVIQLMPESNTTVSSHFSRTETGTFITRSSVHFVEIYLLEKENQKINVFR